MWNTKADARYVEEKQKVSYYCPRCGHANVIPHKIIDQPRLCSYCKHSYYAKDAMSVHDKVRINYFKKQHEKWLKKQNKEK